MRQGRLPPRSTTTAHKQKLAWSFCTRPQAAWLQSCNQDFVVTTGFLELFFLCFICVSFFCLLHLGFICELLGGHKCFCDKSVLFLCFFCELLSFCGGGGGGGGGSGHGGEGRGEGGGIDFSQICLIFTDFSHQKSSLKSQKEFLTSAPVITTIVGYNFRPFFCPLHGKLGNALQ